MSNPAETDTPSYRKVDTLGRQVWDKDFFAAKALARQYEGEDPGVNFLQGDFKKQKKPTPPPVERLPLQQRKETVVLDADVGKAKVITSYTPKQLQGGFWCEICECLMKDSQTYLDHINGKKHNRQLGMTMRVEQVQADKVRQRLQEAKLERVKKQEREVLDKLGGIELRLADANERERQKKKEKKEKKKKKKKRERTKEDGVDNDDINEDDLLMVTNPFEALSNGELDINNLIDEHVFVNSNGPTPCENPNPQSVDPTSHETIITTKKDYVSCTQEQFYNNEGQQLVDPNTNQNESNTDSANCKRLKFTTSFDEVK